MKERLVFPCVVMSTVPTADFRHISYSPSMIVC